MLPPDSDSKATPTDAEQLAAKHVVAGLVRRYEQVDVVTVLEYRLHEAIAQALANQRAKYEAVAEELDRFADDEQHEWHVDGKPQRIGARDAYDIAVSLINVAGR